MKICSQCQTEYDDTKKFCHHDGSPLATKTTGEGAATVENISCPHCGEPVEAGKPFCRQCGARLGGKVQSDTEKETQALLRRAEEKRRQRQEAQKKVAGAAGVVVVVILLGLGGVFGYRKAQEWFQPPASSQAPLAAHDKKLESPPQKEQPSPLSLDILDTQPATAPAFMASSPSLNLESSSGESRPNEPSFPPGRYKVVRATKVFREPRSDAAVLARLSPGKKVKVVGGGGDYARVESTRGRPPGYIFHSDLAPLYRETQD